MKTLALLALLALFVVGCQKPSPEAGEPQAARPAAKAEVGKQAPDFSFETLDGKVVRLADLEGKPVVLNFWASWCPYCVKEAPDLEALYQQYRKSHDLQMLGVAGQDTTEALKGKADDLKLTYPVGISPQTAMAYGVSGIPHTFFIDREGKIVSSMAGARPKAELEAEIKKII
jgi:peroxiredoxin